MRARHCLPALALFLLFPVRGDDSPAAKPPARSETEKGDVKKSPDQPSCCAGEEKAKCPRAKATASPKKPAAATPPGPAEKAAKPAAAGAANMVVTRDPETGEIRNATAEERAKLLDRRPQAAPSEPRVVVLPDGTRMVELGEDSTNYTVARRNPDGTVTQTCVEGPDAAAGARKPKTEAPAPRAEAR